MLIETETEGTIDFFVTFLSVATFQLGEAAPPPSYAYGTSVYCATAKSLLQPPHIIIRRR